VGCVKIFSLDDIDDSRLLTDRGRLEIMFAGWLDLLLIYLVKLFGLVYGV